MIRVEQMERGDVEAFLSNIPGARYFNNLDVGREEMNRWCRFMGKGIPHIEKNIPYNASPFHFFLHYTPRPNIAFVIRGAETMIFGAIVGREHSDIILSFPYLKSPDSAVKVLNELVGKKALEPVIKNKGQLKILLRDIDEDLALHLRTKRKADWKIELVKLREMNYSIYDIEHTSSLKGKKFANLRWHLNSFKESGRRVEAVPPGDHVEEVSHLIGLWRGQAIRTRGFSYADVRSDKWAARLLCRGYGQGTKEMGGEIIEGQISLDDVRARVLLVDGRVAAFNLGYPLGLTRQRKIFAHAVGMADISIPHLAEFAQMDMWKMVWENGYTHINDGPTWRKGLEIYKNKFQPVERKRYYWAHILVKLK